MKKPFMIVLFIIIFALILYCYLPVKIAVKKEGLPTNKKYIIVEHQYTTAGVWMIVGDEKGMYDYPVDASLLGNYPNVGYYTQIGDNQYICYADYIGEELVAEYYKNKVYYVNDWDVLYPIQRERVVPLPKTYLTQLDFWEP